MDAWFGDIYGAETCVKHVTDVNRLYYDEIISKCEGNNRCEDLQARAPGTMECREISEAVYYTDVLVIQYRCSLPPTGTRLSYACFYVSVEIVSCTFGVRRLSNQRVFSESDRKLVASGKKNCMC